MPASPWNFPSCAKASFSVPGAPASSFLTGSHVLVLNHGVEICAPVWVATALLCTVQPPDPRFDMSLAPVSDEDASVLASPTPALRAARPNGAACALVASPASVVATTRTAAQRALRRRMSL